MLHETTISYSQDNLLQKVSQLGRKQNCCPLGNFTVWCLFSTSIFLFVGSQRKDYVLNIFMEFMGHGDKDRRLLYAPVKKYLEHHGALILNATNAFPIYNSQGSNQALLNWHRLHSFLCPGDKRERHKT